MGTLNPELYRSGQVALSMGVEAGPRMTPECAVVSNPPSSSHTGASYTPAVDGLGGCVSSVGFGVGNKMTPGMQ